MVLLLSARELLGNGCEAVPNLVTSDRTFPEVFEQVQVVSNVPVIRMATASENSSTVTSGTAPSRTRAGRIEILTLGSRETTIMCRS